jgi:hypothetical protein
MRYKAVRAKGGQLIDSQARVDPASCHLGDLVYGSGDLLHAVSTMLEVRVGGVEKTITGHERTFGHPLVDNIKGSSHEDSLGLYFTVPKQLFRYNNCIIL